MRCSLSFPLLSHSRIALCLLISAVALILCNISSASAQTWNLAGGGSWNAAANWNPAAVPNSVGASATFNGAATGSNPAQTANRTVTLDAAQTVGSILFNNDLSTFTDTISAGTSGSLTFDAV